MSRRLATEAEYYRPEKENLIAIRWAAPETVEQHKFSQASDVWYGGVRLISLEREFFTSEGKPSPQSHTHPD